MQVGYARVSTTHQNLDPQLEALKGCDKIYQEKKSGKGVKRPELDNCLADLRTGDTLTITRIDRLGRSTVDLVNIIQQLKIQGVGFECIEQPMFNVSAGAGVKPEQQLMLTMMAAFADFETELRKERQADGIAHAKKTGKYTGRKPTLSDKQIIKAIENAGGNKTHAAKALGITYQGLQKRFKLMGNKEIQLSLSVL
jgi:DNA invertase Pin-like site-specific DNA recombinase